MVSQFCLDSSGSSASAGRCSFAVRGLSVFFCPYGGVRPAPALPRCSGRLFVSPASLLSSSLPRCALALGRLFRSVVIPCLSGPWPISLFSSLSFSWVLALSCSPDCAFLAGLPSPALPPSSVLVVRCCARFSFARASVTFFRCALGLGLRSVPLAACGPPFGLCPWPRRF